MIFSADYRCVNCKCLPARYDDDYADGNVDVNDIGALSEKNGIMWGKFRGFEKFPHIIPFFFSEDNHMPMTIQYLPRCDCDSLAADPDSFCSNGDVCKVCRIAILMVRS